MKDLTNHLDNLFKNRKDDFELLKSLKKNFEIKFYDKIGPKKLIFSLPLCTQRPDGPIFLNPGLHAHEYPVGCFKRQI